MARGLPCSIGTVLAGLSGLPTQTHTHTHTRDGLGWAGRADGGGHLFKVRKRGGGVAPQPTDSNSFESRRREATRGESSWRLSRPGQRTSWTTACRPAGPAVRAHSLRGQLRPLSASCGPAALRPGWAAASSGIPIQIGMDKGPERAGASPWT